MARTRVPWTRPSPEQALGVHGDPYEKNSPAWGQAGHLTSNATSAGGLGSGAAAVTGRNSQTHGPRG